MAGSEQFVFKPQSERGGLAILLPSSVPDGASVDIIDASGNVLSSGKYSNRTNSNRPTYRFDKPGNMYGNDVSVQVNYGDESYTIPVGNGATRYEGNGLGIEGIRPAPGGSGSIGGDGQSLGGYTPNIQTSPTGNPYVVPQFFDMSSAQAPFVDMQAATDYAYGIGQLNKDIYFGNITGDQAKQAAMGLLQTDIEGIRTGAEQLVPMVRQQGDIDQQTNIARGQQLDKFNIQRLPQFNQANIKQAQELSRAAQQMRTEQVQAAGLDYKGRITSLLDQLAIQSQGRLTPELDAQLATDTRNRGADIAAATGVSSISGAGVRAQDRLLIGERLAIQQNAQAQLPGVLTQAQAVLQAPEERAPGVYAQPTQVPLAVSNIQDRLPVQSSISAGQAQLGVGTSATQMQTISPSTILGSDLQMQQFNESQRYANEIMNLENQASYMNAVDNAYINAIKEDKADQIREQNFQMFQMGLDAQYQAQQAKAQGMQQQYGVGMQAATPGGATGTLTNVPAPTPAQGATIQTDYDIGNGNRLEVWSDGTMIERAPDGTAYATTRTPQNLAGTAPSGQVQRVPQRGNAQGDPGFLDYVQAGGSALSGLGGFISGASKAYDTVFGDTGRTSVNGQEVTQSGFSGWLGDTFKSLFGSGTAEDTAIRSNLGQEYPTSYNGEAIVDQVTDSNGRPTGYKTESGLFVSNDDVAMEQMMSRRDPNAYSGQKIESSTVVNGQEAYITSDGKTFTKDQIEAYNRDNKPSVFEQSSQALNNVGLDWDTLIKTGDTLVNWGTSSLSNKIQSSGEIGTNILVNKGLLSEEQGRNVSNISGALGTIADPLASNAQKLASISKATSGLMVTSYTGSINQPNTINGSKVIGGFQNQDGSKVFTVQNQNGTLQNITQQELINSSNVTSGLNTFSVLMSNADKETKMTALTAVGIDASAANGIISEVAGGNLIAGLSIFDTARNWDDMNDFQKSISILKTGGTVLNATAGTASTWSNSAVQASSNLAKSATTQAVSKGATQTAASTSAWGTLGTALTTTAALAGGALSIKQARDTILKADDMPRSQAGKFATTNMALSGLGAGASIGSVVPVVGTAIGAAVGLAGGLVSGAVVGSTGSGKGTGQMMRDSWRGGMQSMGIADKDYQVTLADGSKYNIGLEGNAKLTNLDGTKRHTYDVDWGNPLAKNSIPEAHLFNIATGLDPTSNQKFETFNRAVAQNLNAATSNAQSMDDVRANYRSMLEQSGVEPEDLVTQLEVLRAQNKITQDEYLNYIAATNNIFQTSIQPTDAKDARNYLLATLESKGKNLSKYDQYIYEQISNPDRLAYWEYQRDKRLGKEVPKEKAYFGMGKDLSAYKQYAKRRIAQVRV